MIRKLSFTILFSLSLSVLLIANDNKPDRNGNKTELKGKQETQKVEKSDCCLDPNATAACCENLKEVQSDKPARKVKEINDNSSYLSFNFLYYILTEFSFKDLFDKPKAPSRPDGKILFQPVKNLLNSIL